MAEKQFQNYMAFKTRYYFDEEGVGIDLEAEKGICWLTNPCGNV